jgi:hypothetical protein
VAVLGAQALPALIPFAHRFGHRKLWNGVVLSSIATAIAMAVFSMKRPFDEMHQKRLFFLHSENVRLFLKSRNILLRSTSPDYDARTPSSRC